MDKFDRRRVLAATACIAAGAVGGAAGAKAGEAEVTANEDLMREHGVLRRILVLYRETAPVLERSQAGVDVGAVNAAAAVFREFGEQYHEKMLEEQHIFPMVRKTRGKAADLVDVLLAQHARGREITAYILSATASGRIGDALALARAMTGFCRMYEAHTAYEDTIVFPAFRNLLSNAQYKALGDRFEEIERKQFGGDGFDLALAKVEKAQAAVGVEQLSRFTAPPLAEPESGR